MRLYLYGSGNRCKTLLEIIRKTDIEVVGIIDSDSKRWRDFIGDYEIMPPSQLNCYSDEYVCVTFFGEKDYEPVWDELMKTYLIPREMLLSYHDVVIGIYSKLIKIPKPSCSIGLLRNTIFDGAWEFGIGGVEAWLNDTIKNLSGHIDNLVFFTKEKQFNGDAYSKVEISDFCLKDSCNFKYDDIENSINHLMSYLPCTVVCSRVDEIMLAAYLIHSIYPDYLELITVVHGACDGMIRDVAAYCEGTKKYICVSKTIKKMMQCRGVENAKLMQITAPVNVDDNIQRTYSMDCSKPIRIGYAGRIEVFHKRSDLLIELINKLEQLEVNYVFEIVGEGSFSSQLKEYIHSNDLEGKVLYSGAISRGKILDFWYDKDISINVSDSEGRPISNIEAMCCGAVPVVTSTAGIIEDVQDGTTGFVVEVGDMEHMASVIKNLDKNRILLKEVGERARDYMIKEANAELYIAKWKEILSPDGCI